MKKTERKTNRKWKSNGIKNQNKMRKNPDNYMKYSVAIQEAG